MTPHFLLFVINDSFVRVATCACARQAEPFRGEKLLLLSVWPHHVGVVSRVWTGQTGQG